MALKTEIIEKIKNRYSKIGKMKRNLFALIFLIINITVITLLLFLYQSYRKNTIEENTDNYSIIIDQANDITEGIIWDYMTNAASLATLDRDIENVLHYNETNYSESEVYTKKFAIQQKLMKLKLKDEYIISAYLFGLNNNLIITDKGSYNTLDTFIDGKFYHFLKESILNSKSFNNIYIRNSSNSLPGQSSNKDMVSFVYPIYQTPRQGIIVLNVKIKKFDDVLKTMDKHLKGYSLLLDSSSNVITSYKNLNKASDVNSILQNISPGQSYSELSYNGETISVFLYKNAMGWSLIHVVPYKILFKRVFIFRNTLLLIGFLNFMLSIFFSIIISFYLYKPIEKLINSLKSSNFNDISHVQSDEFKFFEDIYRTLIEKNIYFDQKLVGYKPLLKEIFLYDVIRGKLPSETPMKKELNELDIPLGKSQMCCILLQIDYFYNYKNIYNIQQQEEHLKHITNIVKQISGNAVEIISHMIERNIILILHDSNTLKHLSSLYKMLDDIKNRISDGTGISITIGVGSIVTEMLALKQSYSDAITCIRYKMITGGDRIITMQDIRYDNEITGIDHEMKNQLLHSIKNINYEESTRILKECVYSVKFCTNLEDLAAANISQILNLFKDILEEIQVNMPEYNEYNVYNVIQKYETLEGINNWIQLKMLDTINHIEQYIKDKNSVFLNDIILWIGENYQNPNLQLAAAAEHFNFSTNYFGKLFSKLTGSTFNQYVNDVRLEKALELLNSTNEKIIEISKGVGFNSTQYFIKVFKAKYGITPSAAQKLNGVFNN